MLFQLNLRGTVANITLRVNSLQFGILPFIVMLHQKGEKQRYSVIIVMRDEMEFKSLDFDKIINGVKSTLDSC